MLKRDYSAAANAGRCGHSGSGTYMAPYKSEPLITGVIFGVVGVLAVLLALFAVGMVRDNLKDDSSDLMLLLAVAVCLLLLETLVILTGIVLIRFARTGYKCSYIADEERFITDEGGNSRTIYYADVQAVHFVPRSVWGKVRGYEVTVVLNGFQEEYELTSDGFISEKTTPFYIIVERVEEIRRQQAHERYKQELARLGTSASTAPMQQSVSAGKQSFNRLGQDAQMPAVNLSDIAEAAPEKASSSGKSDNKNDRYIDDDGRERLYSDILGTGRFKVLCSPKKTTTLALVAAAGLAMAIITVIMYLLLDELNPAPIHFMQPQDCLLALIGVALAALMVIIYLIGDEYTYRANGREFVVADKKGCETRIVYSDVQSVHYLNMLLGYKVEILTQYGIISFKCLDKRKRVYEKPEKLPFHIIEKMIKN